MSSEPNARQIALDALIRIEEDRAYANLALGPILERSGLDKRDRAFVTDLVYGTIRMQRRLDHLVDRFLVSDPPLEARMALRLGAYQLDVLATPPHAAIGETVEVTSKRFRGLVNAVLRKVSTAGSPSAGRAMPCGSAIRTGSSIASSRSSARWMRWLRSTT